MKTLYDILEGWVQGVKTKWHPKEGLFTGDDPQYIADYLLKHSKDRGQAMQRLVFYMNRAGKKCPNKTVLNKAKKILSESLLDADFDVDDEVVFTDALGLKKIFDKVKWSRVSSEEIKTSKNIWHDTYQELKDKENFWEGDVDYTVYERDRPSSPKDFIVCRDGEYYIITANTYKGITIMKKDKAYTEKYLRGKGMDVRTSRVSVDILDYIKHILEKS